MTTWFTADLHFGHLNIIEYTGRPYDSVDEMNDDLVARWNETVRPDDIVWILGDFAMGQIRESLKITHLLHGYKILLSGNHDRTWHGHGPDAVDWYERYLDSGFAEVHSGITEIQIGAQKILACHFPYQGDSHDAERFVPFRPRDEGRWLVHGHVHTTWAQNDRMINVGVDVSDRRPVSEERIAELIAAGPTTRDSIDD